MKPTNKGKETLHQYTRQIYFSHVVIQLERKDNRPSNLGGKKPPAPRTNGAPHTKAPKQEPNRTKINRNDKEDKNVKNTKPFARPRHDIETMHNPHPASALNQLQDKIPDHLHRFCNGLKNHSTPELLVTNNVHHWIQAFSLSYEAPHLMKIHLFWLAKVLVNLPDKDKYTPDPTHVLKVVKEIVTSTKRDPPFDLIFKVAERLQSSTSTRKISNPKALIDILAELEDEIATLFRRARRRDDEEDNDHILSRYKQLEVVLDEYRPVIRKASTSRQNNSTDESLSCMRWYRDPNIQWLLDAEWLSIPTLHEKYSSVDDYVQTIQKLWTSMTFYWGASVFFPRCRSREGPNPDKTCQNPVLSLPHHHSQTCNNMVSVNGHTDVCGKPAKYCCYRRGHDAICGDCLNKRRAGLLGKPGPNASTDFYDAQVTKISSRNDSIVLQLNRLKSRKPPEADINWATSYRLQISNLVGVVPLATANSSLNGSLPFYLGEIIALEAIPDELRKKRNGELSVRLLSRNDSALLSNSTTLTLGRNDHVGIIDFRVFVPEVISVLSTICHSSFNDAFTRVRFAQPLLGNISHLGDPQEVYRGLDCNAQIYHAIMHSTIRSLQTLSIQAKQIIIRDLCSIRVIQTMDRTQLLAFCAGLQNALHCIQGPPGTGKVRFCNPLAVDVSQFMCFYRAIRAWH